MHTRQRFLNTIAALQPVLTRIERRDKSLASQTRRALQSAALQYAEAIHARGGNRNAKFQGALAEAKEAHFALQLAVASGYLRADQAEAHLDAVDRLAATLWLKLHRPHG